LNSVLRPSQHIGYIGDGFYRSKRKDPTNSIKVLKEKRYKGKSRQTKNKIHIYIHNVLFTHKWRSVKNSNSNPVFATY